MSLKTSYCGYVLYEKKKNTPNTRILMVKGYIKQSQTNIRRALDSATIIQCLLVNAHAHEFVGGEKDGGGSGWGGVGEVREGCLIAS